MQIKSRNMLSKKDKKTLKENLEMFYGEGIILSFEKTLAIEEVRTDEGTFLVKDGRIWFFDYDKQQTPTIHFLRENKIGLPKIVVDTGAIRFITNGADVMAPGIVYFDEKITEGSVVSIHEEKADSLLGVGISLVNSEKFEKTKQGKVIKTIHHLKDDIWKFQL
ncbi:MAG: DUF1947 domain-containing protein [Candidatus Heimdallarchaeota archaeon]|nr:DUF1947 domain-containing protein [Candidatus Heimdallarchaeota archaeon]